MSACVCSTEPSVSLARSTPGSLHVTRNRLAGGPGGAGTAPPPGSRVCETGLRRGVRVSSLDLGVTGGKERQMSGEATRSPNKTHGGKQSAGITT